MLKWEYEIKGGDCALDNMGANGWELVSVVVVPAFEYARMAHGSTVQYIYYFKRPLPDHGKDFAAYP